MYKRLLTFLLFLAVFELLGQLPFQSFDKEFIPVPVRVDEGMAISDYKRRLVEDKDGVIWMATNRGVVRYDGFQSVNFTQYLKRKFPDKVKIDDVMAIALDRFDQLWMGSIKGLSMYNLRTKTYLNLKLDEPLYTEDFRNETRNLLVSKNELYVGTDNGLYIVDLVSHKVKDKYLTNGEIHSNRAQTSSAISGIYPDLNDSLIYIQANDGMHVINKKNGKDKLVETELLHKTSKWWDNSHWFYQGEFADGKIITATYNTGIAHFDIKKEEYEIFLPDPTRSLYPNQNIFKSLTALNDSVFILAARHRGLYAYNYPQRKLTAIKDAPYLENGGILDSYGHYWIGRWGALYRSRRQLGASSGKKQSLQIGQVFTKNRSLGYVTLENIENIRLENHQTDLKLFISLTQSYRFDSLIYQYNYCNLGWKDIPDQVLELNDIKDGAHTLDFRVVSNNETIKSTSINLNRYVPWYFKWYYLALILASISLIYYFIYRWRLGELLARQELNNKYELEISKLNTIALRSRMNPHFLFNTLNSIKHHALFKSKEETGEYINVFSELIRGILEYSTLDLLPLSDDIAWMEKYINIEKKRFQSPFDFSLIIDPHLDLERKFIPPLLIQPYVENAIWHGLHNKKENRKLELNYVKLRNGYQITILDNGVGRKHAASFKSKSTVKKKSLEMQIIDERIQHINAQNKQEIIVSITDLNEVNDGSSGTKVTLTFIDKI